MDIVQTFGFILVLVIIVLYLIYSYKLDKIGKKHGFTSYKDFEEAQQLNLDSDTFYKFKKSRFNSVDMFKHATSLGFTNEYDYRYEHSDKGYETHSDYCSGIQGQFDNAAEYYAAKKYNIANRDEYNTFIRKKDDEEIKQRICDMLKASINLMRSNVDIKLENILEYVTVKNSNYIPFVISILEQLGTYYPIEKIFIKKSLQETELELVFSQWLSKSQEKLLI